MLRGDGCGKRALSVGGEAGAAAAAATAGDDGGTAGECVDTADCAGSIWTGAGVVSATDAADEGAIVGAGVAGAFGLGAGLQAHKPSADNRISRLSSMTAPCGCCERSACAVPGAVFSWQVKRHERHAWLATFV